MILLYLMNMEGHDWQAWQTIVIQKLLALPAYVWKD